MLTNKAVNFLNGIQKFVRATEALLIDVISMLIPWASPVIPAFLCFNSVSTVLLFPIWVAFVTAAVVELLGLATINTVFEMWSFNTYKNKSEASSPVGLALGVSIFYLTIILVVNTMLDDAPIIHKIAKGLLSLLTAVGGVTIAMRAAHARRLQENESLRNDRKLERMAQRQQVMATANLPVVTNQNQTSPFVRANTPGGNGSGPIQSTGGNQI